MTDARSDDEHVDSKPELETGKSQTTGGPWDPFSYLRKTISPAFRMELLRLKRPILPPEDFMDTADFKRARIERLRHFLPALVGLAALILASLLGLGFWLHRSPPLADGTLPATTRKPQLTPPATEATPNAPPPATAPSVITSERPVRVEAVLATQLAPPMSAAPPIRTGTNSRPATPKKTEIPPVKPSASAAPEPTPADTFWKKPQ
jgi:hypothetical protein